MKELRAKVIPWMNEQGNFWSNYQNLDTGWNNIMRTLTDFHQRSVLISLMLETQSASVKRFYYKYNKKF
ncbi:MAG: hypothetical protein FWH22_07170 [Fibromonadales bacterium]|nr:hypothetical protein [Fibromonadales bacterium]